MCGVLSLVGEIVDQALRVFGLESDDACELALEMRVVDVEPLGDELGVVVVLGEDDGLAQPVAASHLLPARHQMLQHLVHGVRIEQPLVDRFCLHSSGTLPSSFHSSASHCSFSSSDSSSYLMPSRWNLSGTETAWAAPEIVVHRILQRVGIRRHAGFQVEQAIGVAVDFILGRGSQPHQQRIEILEDGAVFLIHRAVRLVDDDQVEMPDAKTALPVLRLVDQPHHRRIGGDDTRGPRCPSR